MSLPMPYRANSSHRLPVPQIFTLLLSSNPPQAARFFPPPPPYCLLLFPELAFAAAPDLVEASFLIEFRGFENLTGPSSSLSFFLHSFTLFKLLTPLHACPMRHLSA